MGVLVSCSKVDSSAEPTPSGGTKKFVVLSDIHLMHPDLLVSEGEAFDKYNWKECKLLRESPEIFAATLGRGLDDARAKMYDFLDSAYNNYYGADHTPIPDDSITLTVNN